MKKVLFISERNSVRSQMAEGLLNHLRGAEFLAFSASIEQPQRVHPMAVAVMAEIGIDISRNKSKSLGDFTLSDFFQIIHFVEANTLPETLSGRPLMHWSVVKPEQDTHPEEFIRKFRKIRDKIRSQIQNWGNTQPW